MRTRERIAADLASAASCRLNAEIKTEPSKQAKTAKITARDQLLEAAYNLMTGNVPLFTPSGWLVRSKSTMAGTLVHLRIGNLDVQKRGNSYIVDNGELLETSSIDCELQVAQGKVYIVDLNVSQCTCAGGNVPGKICWHMCACEFYVEAGQIARRNNGKGFVTCEARKPLLRLPRRNSQSGARHSNRRASRHFVESRVLDRSTDAG